MSYFKPKNTKMNKNGICNFFHFYFKSIWIFYSRIPHWYPIILTPSLSRSNLSLHKKAESQGNSNSLTHRSISATEFSTEGYLLASLWSYNGSKILFWKSANSTNSNIVTSCISNKNCPWRCVVLNFSKKFKILF